jgi:DNA-binding CsgD family transcriptional regulator
VIVGRDRELAVLTDERAVCVEGAPGIGKSTLLAAAAALAGDRGHTVLFAKASVSESDFAFGVVRQLLEPVPDDDGFAALDALYRHVARLSAAAPLFLAVDDVDLADLASLRWLAYLRRRTRNLPITVAVTVGTSRQPRDRALLMEALSGTKHLRLRPLDASACAQLVRGVLAPQPVAPEFATACHTVTDGNPFLLHELLHTLAEEDTTPDAAAVLRCRPPWLADRLLARLAAQDIAHEKLVRTVAVLGTAPLEVAAAAADLPVLVAADAARSLTRMSILTTGSGLELRSSITQNTIAESVSPLQRDVIHTRAAVLLHAQQAPTAYVADHLLHTTSVTGKWVVDVLRTVGRQAMIDGENDLAVGCLRRALREDVDERTRDELLLALGIAEVPAEPLLAVEHLTAVGANHAWPARFADIVRAYATAMSGDGTTGAAQLPSRAGEPDDDLPDAEFRAALELCYVVITLICTDELADARRCCAEAGTAVARTLGALVDYRSGDVTAAFAAVRNAMTAGSGGSSGWLTEAVSLPVLLECAVDRGELELAQEVIEYSNLNGRLPQHWRYHYLLYSRGRIHAARGNLRAALEDQLECGRRFQQNGIHNPAFVPWRAHAAVLHHRLGEHDEAVALAEEDLSAAHRWGRPRALGIALRTAGVVRGGERGRELFERSTVLLEQAGARLELARTLCQLRLSLARDCRHTEAAQLQHRVELLAEQCGAPALACDGDRQQSLTPHERRIAILAVEGRTNREIADGLRVTPRAVEQHLTKIYRKLGITRRAQLGRALN